MSLDDIRPHIEKLSDVDLITLLNEISDEVKRRNTIMKGILGAAPPAVQKENIKQGIQTLIDLLATKPKT